MPRQTEAAKARAADPYFRLAIEARREARQFVQSGVIEPDEEEQWRANLLQIAYFERCQYLEWQLKQAENSIARRD